jgi:hypothetical protein
MNGSALVKKRAPKTFKSATVSVGPVKNFPGPFFNMASQCDKKAFIGPKWQAISGGAPQRRTFGDFFPLCELLGTRGHAHGRNELSANLLRRIHHLVCTLGKQKVRGISDWTVVSSGKGRSAMEENQTLRAEKQSAWRWQSCTD